MKKVDLKNKKEFYVTELHMGDDGLESTTDYAGPFTLNKARKVLERMFKYPGAFINPYNYSIRGPRHTNENGNPTEFYAPGEWAREIN